MIKEEILKLRANGHSYKSIKKILNCSLSTISYHCGDGQKSKSSGRNKSRRKNVLLSKCTRFEYVRKNNKTEERCKSKSGRERDLYFKTVNFQRDRLSGGEYVRNFTEKEVRDKFKGETKCYLSGMPIDLNDGKTYELDHIVPCTREGIDNHYTLDNLELINPKVNRMKGNQTNEEFLKMVFMIADHCKDQRDKILGAEYGCPSRLFSLED